MYTLIGLIMFAIPVMLIIGIRNKWYGEKWFKVCATIGCGLGLILLAELGNQYNDLQSVKGSLNGARVIEMTYTQVFKDFMACERNYNNTAKDCEVIVYDDVVKIQNYYDIQF